MGMSLNALRPKVAEEDRVLVTIVTDGYENASREYNGKAIKVLVDELKDKGWVFAYIGANQDVEKVAATISITNTMTFQTTSHGTKRMTCLLYTSKLRTWKNPLSIWRKQLMNFKIWNKMDFVNFDKENKQLEQKLTDIETCVDCLLYTSRCV